VSAAAVLTFASTVTCNHSASAVFTPPGTAKLSVAGVRVLTGADLMAALLTCPGANGVGKCSGIIAVMDGISPAKLTVARQPVVRTTLSGTTNGAPTTLTCKANQSTLTTASGDSVNGDRP
jgi:hypothetical protein